MKKILFFGILAMSFVTFASAETIASGTPQIKVSNISTSSATLFLTNIDKLKITNVNNVINFLNDGYFKYTETNKVCIAIYPTPEECLPKQIKTGSTTADIVGLKPNTEYSAWFYRGSSIACITTPCPTNEWQSNNIKFKTLPISINSSSTNSTSTKATSSPGYLNKIKRDIWYRIRNDDVKLLQEILIKLGYLKSEVTGYFGNDTLKAVKKYQKEVMQIPPTGKVGPLTRESLSRERDDDRDFSSSTLQTWSKEKENDDYDKKVSSSTNATSSKEKNDKHDDDNKNGNGKGQENRERENDDR